MGLTKDDLSAIQTIVVTSINDAIEDLVNPRFDELETRMDNLEDKMTGMEGRMDGLEGRMGQQESSQQETNRLLKAIEVRLETSEGKLEALQNDIVELYRLTNKLNPMITDKKFSKLSPDEKVKMIHAEVLELAKHFDVRLPNSQ